MNKGQISEKRSNKWIKMKWVTLLTSWWCAAKICNTNNERDSDTNDVFRGTFAIRAGKQKLVMTNHRQKSISFQCNAISSSV